MTISIIRINLVQVPALPEIGDCFIRIICEYLDNFFDASLAMYMKSIETQMILLFILSFATLFH